MINWIWRRIDAIEDVDIKNEILTQLVPACNGIPVERKK